mgnify:CR=1 FL=1
MKSIPLFAKYSTLIVVLALILTLAFSHSVYAQSAPVAEVQESREEVLTGLNQALTQISTAVRNSPDLSIPERVAFLTSLIEVSRAILSVQGTTGLVAQPTTEQVQRPTGTITLEDAQLYKVAVQLDIDSFEADLSYYYTEDLEAIAEGSVYVEYDIQQSTVQLTEPTNSNTISFAQKVANAKEQVIDLVVEETDILRSELSDAVLISSRNPIRDSQNARQSGRYGETLLEDFGVYSIIQEIELYTTGNGSTISITSDQEETLRIIVSRVLPERQGGGHTQYTRGYGVGPFTYELEFYTSEVRGSYRRERGDSERIIFPVYSETELMVSRDEIIQVLTDFFGEQPFAEGIDDISDKTLEFLVSNRTRIPQNEGNPAVTLMPLAHAQQCISEADALVMNEILTQLAKNLGTQFIVSEEAIQYRIGTPTSGTLGTCSGVRDYF